MVEEGKKAPQFTLPDSEGNKVALKSFLGKKVVLYFYPKDMTPGCTTEACDFRDSHPEFEKLDAVVLGVSKDSKERHKKFIENNKLPFTLLSDEDGKVIEKYGVWQEKKLYGKAFMGIVRSTFIIDEQGKIIKHFPKVRVKGHVQEILKIIKGE